MSDESIEEKLNAILELLRPKDRQPAPEKWEDVTEHCFEIEKSVVTPPPFRGEFVTEINVSCFSGMNCTG